MEKICAMVNEYGPLAGRTLLALIFILSGWGKITGFDGTVAYMAAKGMPLVAPLAVGAILVELGAGIALVLGWRARWAAAAIFLFMIPATLIFHDFWAVDASQAQVQTIHFLKNLGIMGGMVYIVAFGAGPLSLDARRA